MAKNEEEVETEVEATQDETTEAETTEEVEPAKDDPNASGPCNCGKHQLPATVRHLAFTGEGKHYRNTNQACE